MKSKVFVYNAEYDIKVLRTFIKKAFEEFNLLDFSNKRILIKPNLLMASSPEKAITTHPTVIEAIVEVLKEKRAKDIYIGDTPGNSSANMEYLYKATGMEEVAERTGAKLINLYKEGIINIPGNNFINSIPIVKFTKDVDFIINVPKLKTHSFMLMTCVIKNLFGLVPGMNKSKMHSIAISPKSFAEILVDIFKEINPILNIVDAIVGMEGEGPSAGIPRKFGKIIIGTDPVAVDVISSLLLGYKPEEIYTNVIAYEKGLGEIDLKNIEVIGEEKDKLYNEDVKRIRNLHNLTSRIPKFLNKIAPFFYLKLFKQIPVILDEKCIRCKICERACPNKAISLINNRMIIDYKKCISCFCCHELCPQKAVIIKKSSFAKLLFK
ncbi:MAG: DUF362 domain-containing protein [Dictyoglomus sp.]|nr:DUF362 domain-containing protein [Dictyoglomus sp.]MDW8189214.1 DUF362 domain-containing protein [Dictyoglomus sp.]